MGRDVPSHGDKGNHDKSSNADYWRENPVGWDRQTGKPQPVSSNSDSRSSAVVDVTANGGRSSSSSSVGDVSATGGRSNSSSSIGDISVSGGRSSSSSSVGDTTANGGSARSSVGDTTLTGGNNRASVGDTTLTGGNNRASVGDTTATGGRGGNGGNGGSVGDFNIGTGNSRSLGLAFGEIGQVRLPGLAGGGVDGCVTSKSSGFNVLGIGGAGADSKTDFACLNMKLNAMSEATKIQAESATMQSLANAQAQTEITRMQTDVANRRVDVDAQQQTDQTQLAYCDVAIKQSRLAIDILKDVKQAGNKTEQGVMAHRANLATTAEVTAMAADMKCVGPVTVNVPAIEIEIAKPKPAARPAGKPPAPAKDDCGCGDTKKNGK